MEVKMDIKKLILSIGKEKHKDKEITTSYLMGALAKRKRLSLKMTQQEVAKDICSISYLSKFESNKLIPNDAFLNSLMEKMDIKKWDMYALKNSKDLLIKATKSYFKYDRDGYKEVYEMVEGIDNNHCVDTIIIGWNLLNDNYEKAKELIENNQKISSSMDNDTLWLFTYFSCVYLLKTKEYGTLSELISCIEGPYFCDELRILFLNLYYDYYIETKRPIVAKEVYDKLIVEYKNKLLVKRINDTVLSLSFLFMNEGEYDKAIEIIANVISDDKEFDISKYNYILAKTYYRLNKLICAKEYLDQIDIYDSYYEYVIDMKYNIANDKQKVVEEVVTFKNMNNYSFYAEYLLKSQANTLTRDDFRSKEFVSYYLSKDVYTKIDILCKEREFLIGINRYKEAINVTRKIEIMKRPGV